MSPKKKLEAALDSLFSSPRTPSKKNGYPSVKEPVSSPVEVVQELEPPTQDDVKSEAAVPVVPAVKDLAAAQNPPVHEIAVVENAPAEIPAALATETPKPVKKTFAEAALTKSPAAVPAAPAPQVVKLDAVKAADSAAVEKAANDHLQLVIFVLNRQYYGVDIAIVESIIKMQTVTRLPKAQPYVRGLTNLRGMVLPVFDLRKRFNLAEQNTTHTSRIVVVRVNQAKIGMVVDEVSEVMTDHNCTLEPAPAIAMSIDTTFIKGIAKVDERLIIVLDLTKVITQPEKKARTKV